MSSNGLSLPALDGSTPVLPDFVDFMRNITPTVHAPPCMTSLRIAHVIRPFRSGSEGTVVAILVNCDTFLYHALTVGLIRASLVPFPVSPHDFPHAIANMLQQTDLSSRHNAACIPDLIDATRAILDLSYALELTHLPALSDTFAPFASPDHPLRAPSPYPPVPHRILSLYWCCTSALVESRQRDIRWAAMTPSPFHAMCIIMQLYAPLVSGQPSTLFLSRAHEFGIPATPTPQNTIDAARRSHAIVITTTPTLLEEFLLHWAHNEEDIKFFAIASLHALTFAGGLLSLVNGNKIFSSSIRLYAFYCATKFGAVTATFDVDDDVPSETNLKATGKSRSDWRWMQFNGQCSVRWVSRADGTHELHFLTCVTVTHQPSAENFPGGEKGYSTSDLWEQHPTSQSHSDSARKSHRRTFAGFWAIMFGRGRAHPGVLIELRHAAAIQLDDASAFTTPQVEEANALAPMYGSVSAIAKEMVLLGTPLAHFCVLRRVWMTACASSYTVRAFVGSHVPRMMLMEISVLGNLINVVFVISPSRKNGTVVVTPLAANKKTADQEDSHHRDANLPYVRYVPVVKNACARVSGFSAGDGFDLNDVCCMHVQGDSKQGSERERNLRTLDMSTSSHKMSLTDKSYRRGETDDILCALGTWLRLA
ncbi:hypothetical protein BKA93DRAFT_754258 [Sparassis latifolia]